MYQNLDHLRQDDVAVRGALRFSLVVAICRGHVSGSGCGVGQHVQRRHLLALGAPAILLVGALRAFVRTYQSRRRNETTWAWQAAGWFLLTLMLVVLTASMPALAGPVFAR